MRRRVMLGLMAIGVIPIPLTVHGQQPAKVVRIGFLGAESAQQAQSDLNLLRAGLREMGYVDGPGLAFEVRTANGEYGRLPDLAKELVGTRIDVLVTSGSKAGIAAKEATAVVPVLLVGAVSALLPNNGGTISSFTLRASATAQKYQRGMELVLALDTTSSMAASDRLTNLNPGFFGGGIGQHGNDTRGGCRTA